MLCNLHKLQLCTIYSPVVTVTKGAMDVLSSKEVQILERVDIALFKDENTL